MTTMRDREIAEIMEDFGVDQEQGEIILDEINYCEPFRAGENYP